MSSRIVYVDQMDKGILVNFADGTIYFFEAGFLYGQMDKRLGPPLKSALMKRSSVSPVPRPRNMKRK